MNVHIDDKDMDAFHDMHDRFATKIGQFPTITELTHRILAGKDHLSDYLDHPHLLLLEDAITQAGQGQIVDRNAELLGRTDVGVAAMRRVYAREMQAIADGRPTKQWKRLEESPALGF
jgi:5,5'-dehydrodivanillate O-demethylase